MQPLQRILSVDRPRGPAEGHSGRWVPIVVTLFVCDFPGHDYWATALFCLAISTDRLGGRIARSRGRTSELGSLLDPVADKLLVLTVLIVLIGRDVPCLDWLSGSTTRGSRRGCFAAAPSRRRPPRFRLRRSRRFRPRATRFDTGPEACLA
jgi:hypothetical protein